MKKEVIVSGANQSWSFPRLSLALFAACMSPFVRLCSLDNEKTEVVLKPFFLHDYICPLLAEQSLILPLAEDKRKVNVNSLLLLIEWRQHGLFLVLIVFQSGFYSF